MEWMKKHADTVVILTGVLAAFGWMNASINSLRKDCDDKFSALQKNMNTMEKDIAVIKTVLIMKDMMPKELCKENYGLDEKTR